jgi:hypothetical protein
MFNLNFADLDTSKIVNEVKSKGYCVFEEALNQEYIDELLGEIDFNNILVNNNDVGVVIAEDIKFLTHCLASSKKTYDIITSRKILDICQEYFDDDYKLTNHRIFQTSRNAHMPWHTDNNLQVGKKLVSKHDMPGLLFLFYFSDVTKNAFQYLKDSHKWSHKYSHEIYFSDSFINENYKNQILSFPMKKGTVIISDIHGIHRAEPFHDAKYSRTTLLFQVDQVGNKYMGHGEKNLVNTEYLDSLTPEIMDYLGFGFPRTYPAFPSSSAATIKIEDMLALQKQLLPQIIKALSKNLVKYLLPSELFIFAKRILWNLKSK